VENRRKDVLESFLVAVNFTLPLAGAKRWGKLRVGLLRLVNLFANAREHSAVTANS